MVRARRCAVLLVFLTFVIPHSMFAQRRRPSSPPPSDEITILQTTDLHHHANGAGHVGFDVDPSFAMSTSGAYARIASYVTYVRGGAGHPVILVDSGDWTMGTLYDLTIGSRPLALAFMSAMRYDAITLGNHEFDYTPLGLAGMLNTARTSFNFQVPIVASNMKLNGNETLAPFYGAGKAIAPSYVKQLSNGLKVGFIGLMGEEAAIEAPASAPVSFTPLSTSYDTIQALVDDLRNNQGAKVVIALSHSGTDATGTFGEDVNLARHVKGINVIASGHTHTPLSSLHSVTNGTWTTQIIDAGAFGTNVARLDLQVNRSNGSTVSEGFSNTAMTNAGLTGVKLGLVSDVITAGLVNATDQQLNAGLAPVLKQTFSDYDAASLAKGIYHVAATATQDMNSNDRNPVLSPNGLGDLAADSVRNVPNTIIAQALTAAGGNPANLPGFDTTPFQVGIVATGVLRNDLPGGVPLTFADMYDVLPLGISPDSTQALPIGYPMMYGYVDVSDLKKICALQLVAQSNLVSSSFYLNLSGIRYSLKPAETYTYFKYATAAAALTITQDKAARGSASAFAALKALNTLASDLGAALLDESAGGNPYSTAMLKLNDPTTDFNQIIANLTVLGEVATAALKGTNVASGLVVSKAVNAIDTVSAFSVGDAMNTGATTDLTSGRVRAAVDLYAMLLIGAVEAQYGVKVTAYQTATGTVALSSADMVTLLGNRIDMDPATKGVQELKEWTALLANVGSGLKGKIGPEYASTPLFTDFPNAGAAVKTRNASYPLASIGQLAGTMSTLQKAP